MRVVKIIVSKIKPLEMNKIEKVAARVKRTVETAAMKVKTNGMAIELITLYPIP